MFPETIGHRYDVGRVVPACCIKNDPLEKIKIKENCFFLLLIRKGKVVFDVAGRNFEAEGPCFVCFDEKENPVVIDKTELECYAVYFHPMFLNVNMTFECVHSKDFAHVATAHDLFLLKPFTDEQQYVFPLASDSANHLWSLFEKLEDELSQQYDWYWSCRSRSYFMEMMLMLERIYSVTSQWTLGKTDSIINQDLKKAVFFIEDHYQQDIRLEDIAQSAALNHSTITQLFRKELDTTPVAYLWQYRIVVAKKHLAFTNLPIKEVALRCGFKTVPHFCRKFVKYTRKTPTEFREKSLAARKAAF